MFQIYKIDGNPAGFEDLNVFHKLAQQFLPFAHKRLGFDKPVSVNLLSDPQNAKNPLGKTAYYDPNKMKIKSTYNSELIVLSQIIYIHEMFKIKTITHKTCR